MQTCACEALLKKAREGKEERKKGRKEERKKGRKEERKTGRKEDRGKPVPRSAPRTSNQPEQVER
jgi:hypothetical protein